MAKLTITPDNAGQVPGQSVVGRSGHQAHDAFSPQQQPPISNERAPLPSDSVPIPGRDLAGASQRKRREEQADRRATSLFKGDDDKAAFGPDYGYKRIRFHKGDEVNPYADEQDARFGIDPRTKRVVALAVICVILFVLVSVLPTNVFNVSARTDRTIGTFASETAVAFQGFLLFFTNPNSAYATHVLTVLVTMLAGAAMGLSGGVFQGAMKNALASPSTLGVTNGGTLGAIIYAVVIAPLTIGATFTGRISEYAAQVEQMDPVQRAFEQYGSFLSSLVGCVVVVFLVMLIALLAGRGKVSNASLVIAGQVFAAAITVVITWMRNWLMLHGDETALAVLSDAQTATFTGMYDVLSVALFAVPLLLCMVAIMLMSNRLTLLAFNDDEARTMGISTAATRNTMVALCTIMTALVVSFCGAVGFVGFMVPHIARRMVGPNFRYLLPTSALLGAAMVCIVFYISELGIPWIPSGSTGVVTSVVGCVTFIVMAVRSRGDASGAWI